MISAIILAAGQSKRMGEPKMLLHWGKVRVIEHVISTFLRAGIKDIVVVTGGARHEVERAVEEYPVRTRYNAEHATGEMLSSLQNGLRALSPQAEAALVGLGDQPQVEERIIRLICEAYRESESRLVVPSFHKRRGHPWLVKRPLWGELLGMEPPQSPRDFLGRYSSEIQYVNVDTASILADLDTPEEYRNSHP
jgi:molybdenum cofactor cytidylyltransferase